MYVCVMVYPFNYLFIYPFHEIGNGRPCPYGQKGTSFDTCSGMLGLYETISMQTLTNEIYYSLLHHLSLTMDSKEISKQVCILRTGKIN